MNIQEIREILNKVSFAPTNLDMGWDWNIQPTKIYDDYGVVLEKGFSVRTTFMRPDANTGEIEKGYGRWMYVPENVSTDGIVKTAWVCAELIVKHELMEAFLYEQSRIFDPHKSLKDLQHNGRTVDSVVESQTKEKKRAITQDVVDAATEVASKDIRLPKVVRDGVVKVKEETVTSDKLFHNQNIDSHIQEITEYLEENLIKKDNRVDPTMSSDIDKYIVMTNTVYHSPKDKMVRLVESSNSKIIDYRAEEMYTLSEVKNMLSELVAKSYLADSAVINQQIYSAGFTIGEPKDDFWIFKNPDIDHRYIVHSEIDHSFAVISKKGDVVSDATGREMVYEDGDYTMENLKKVLSIVKM